MISASDAAVVNRPRPRSRTIHRARVWSGAGFIASDSTLVSRTIIFALLERGRLAYGLTRERLQFDSAQWFDDCADRIIEVVGSNRRIWVDERVLKDFACLDLHGATVLGRTLHQALS